MTQPRKRPVGRPNAGRPKIIFARVSPECDRAIRARLRDKADTLGAVLERTFTPDLEREQNGDQTETEKRKPRRRNNKQK